MERRDLAQLAVPGDAEALRPLLHALLVAANALPLARVVVTDAHEVGEVGAQDVVDLLLPGRRVVQVVEVALVHDGVGALVLYQLEDRPGAVGLAGGLPALVADEGDDDGLVGLAVAGAADLICRIVAAQRDSGCEQQRADLDV